MIFLKSLIYGIVQGLSEFLPISSSGHLAILHGLWPIGLDNELLFDIALHVGSILAVILALRKDIRKLIRTYVAIAGDLFYNFRLYLRSEGGSERSAYRKILKSNYRYLAVMIVTALIPTALLGALLESFVKWASGSLLFPGMGLLFTGIVLIVVDRVDQGDRPPREVSLKKTFAIGLAQGLSVIPGLSRSGTTICSSLLCGMNRRVAVRFSFLLAIPTMIGALVYEIGVTTGEGSFSVMSLGCGVIGALAAAVVGMAAIRKTYDLVVKRKLKYFAYYCFVIGGLAMAGYFLIGGHK